MTDTEAAIVTDVEGMWLTSEGRRQFLKCINERVLPHQSAYLSRLRAGTSVRLDTATGEVLPDAGMPGAEARLTVIDSGGAFVRVAKAYDSGCDDTWSIRKVEGLPLPDWALR